MVCPEHPGLFQRLFHLWTPRLRPRWLCGLCPPVLSPSEQRGLCPWVRPSLSSWRLLPAGPSVGDLGPLILICRGLRPDLCQPLAGGVAAGWPAGPLLGRSSVGCGPKPPLPGARPLLPVGDFQGLHLQMPPNPPPLLLPCLVPPLLCVGPEVGRSPGRFNDPQKVPLVSCWGAGTLRCFLLVWAGGSLLPGGLFRRKRSGNERPVLG